jgi:hypothetical protein
VATSVIAGGAGRYLPVVAWAVVVLGVAPGVGAGIVAQSPDSSIRLDATFNPPALAEGSTQFSFLMWLHRTHSDAQPLSILDVPGAFRVYVDGVAESINAQLGGTPAALEVALLLRDGGGSVPLDEWMLIAVSWDAAAGRFEGWAQSESAGPVQDVVIDQSFVRSPPIGMPSLGRPELAGSAAQQGHYGLIVFRDHAIDQNDVSEIWAGRDYFGPYRLDNVEEGGHLTGTPGAIWLANHAILSVPLPSVIGQISPGLIGLEIVDNNYCVFTTGHPDALFATAAPVVECSTGADAFVFATPYESPTGEPFFVRRIATVEVPLDPPYASGVAPGIRRVAHRAPEGLVRCLVSANSRGTRLSPQGMTRPENYAHGFIEACLDLAVGVINRPARLSANLPWFGFDTGQAPVHSGNVIFTARNDPLRGFARLWSGSGGATAGPGSAVFMDSGAVFALKCRPEPGSLLVADAPLVVRAHLLRFPGAGTLQWRPVKAAAQAEPGTLGAVDTVNLGADSPYAYTLTAQDLVDPAQGRLVLTGDHRDDIHAGDACYVSEGPGERGFSLINSVNSDGQTTDVVFEHWFGVDPAVGSTIMTGSWEIVTISYEWPALDGDDDEVWRGLELTAVDGPLVNFAWDAWRPDVDGIAFGIAGASALGYTPQIQEAFAAAIPAWINALEPDLWFQAFAQQDSEASAMTDFTQCIRQARPTVEVAWLGDAESGLGALEEWVQYILDNAGAAGVVSATILADDTIGTYEDQCADALRSNIVHYSHRGNTRLAERWLELLSVAALPAADLNGDGVVGVGDFLLLLAAWGPCPAPPDACAADLDGDGSVGVTDFLMLLDEWGS